MHVTPVNPPGVSIVAFFVPFILGFFPRVRIASVTLELAGLASALLLPAIATALLGGTRSGAGADTDAREALQESA